MKNTITYHICHYCCEYFTDKLKDIKQHINRKNKCSCCTLLSYSQSNILSTSKKFIFNFDINELNKDDLIFITRNYNETINIINKNFKNIFYENLNKFDNEKNDNEKNDNEKINISNNLLSLLNNLDLNKSLTLFNNNLNNDNLNNDILENDNLENNENLSNFNELYYNKEKDKYICNICFTEYTSKQNMEFHLLNTKKCMKRRKILDAMNANKKNSELILKKKIEDDKKLKAHLFQQNNQFIQTLNNNNTNNNTQHNNYNFAINDFVNERYDITHIKDTFYEEKDFFIYPNFLRMIMENKKNHNLFFSNNEAIFYSDNEIIKMSSEKAGYLVLDKLSQSFEQILNQQDEETRDYYKFISKYYYVIKGHYKHDTIFKDYDVEKQQFFYTSLGNLFRSRDKYLSKIMTTVNKHNDDIRENMNIDGLDIKNIPLINPNIEDFASIKMRYRDLKDRD